jgi:hypothetical protein
MLIIKEIKVRTFLNLVISLKKIIVLNFAREYTVIYAITM